MIVLGLVSLFNDMASDMIAPLLPVFLTATLGAGPAALGLIEGVAEATASLLKMYSGRLADKGVGAKSLTLSGYIISNLSRPLLGAVASWPAALMLRFADRAGKGVRTAPRDAIISSSVDEKLRGKAFGLHRSMDHTGAMIGPLAASGLLYMGYGVREVFYISFIFGSMAVALVAFGVREPKQAPQPPVPPLTFKGLDPKLRGLIFAAGGLAFASAPEAFLVLWISATGVPLSLIPIVWAAAHMAKAAVAMPAGSLSDRVGRLPVASVFWFLRAAIVVVIPWFSGVYAAVGLFFVYSMAVAGSEGAERALIGDSAAQHAKGAAFGLFHMVIGVAALPGAVLFGAAWELLGPAAAFTLSAAIMTLSAVIMIRTAASS